MGATQLKAILLQRADLPTTWKVTPAAADPNADKEKAALTSCVGGRNTSGDKVADETSPGYALGNSAVTSQATSYKSQSDVDADVAVMKSPKINTCYQELAKAQIARSLPKGTKINKLTISVKSGSNGGPSNVIGTATGTVDVTASGKRVVVYVSAVFVTGKLVEAEVDFESIGTPFPAGLRTSVTAKVAARANG